MYLLLKRISTGDSGTFGVLLDENNIPFVVTLEPPWKDNQKYISCIPAGYYKCRRTVTSKHGECFEVLNVLDRESILMHIGNIKENTQGCILIGEKFDPVKNENGIAASAEGYEEFMTYLKRVDEFNLRIVETY